MRILFADDQKMFVDAAVALIFRSHPHALIEIVADYQQLYEKVGQTPCYDIVICDLHMPGADRSEGIANIRRLCANAKIILITGSADSAEIGNALSQGADAFIHKTQNGLELVRIIDRLAASLTSRADPAHLKFIPSVEIRFSRREQQTLRLVATGRSTKEIAQLMKLAPPTVKVYIRSLLRKTGAKTRTELAVFAIERGFRPPIPQRSPSAQDIE